MNKSDIKDYSAGLVKSIKSGKLTLEEAVIESSAATGCTKDFARKILSECLAENENKKVVKSSRKSIKSGRYIKSGTSNFGSNNDVFGYSFPLVTYVAENHYYDEETDSETEERDYDADSWEYEDAIDNAKALADEMDIPQYDDYSEPYLCHEPFMIKFRDGYYEGLWIEVKEGTDEEDVYSNDPRYGSVYEGGKPFTDEEMNKFADKLNEYFNRLCSDYGWQKLGVSARFDNGETWYSKIDNSRKPIKSSGLNFEGGNPYRSFVRNPWGASQKVESSDNIQFDVNKDFIDSLKSESINQINWLRKNYSNYDIEVYPTNMDTRYLTILHHPGTYSINALIDELENNPELFITDDETNESGHMELNIWEYYESQSFVIAEFDLVKSNSVDSSRKPIKSDITNIDYDAWNDTVSYDQSYEKEFDDMVEENGYDVNEKFTYMAGVRPEDWTDEDTDSAVAFHVDVAGYYKLGNAEGMVLVGTLKDIYDYCDNYFGMGLHPDYVCPADSFDYEDGEWVTGGWIDSSVKKPIKSGMTYDQALDMFTSEGKPWGDYWSMQQDWTAFVDSLERDGEVDYEEARWWDNPCTPETFNEWVGRSNDDEYDEYYDDGEWDE